MYKPSLTGKIIEVRPSQCKFKSNDFDLEIIRCGTFS